MNEDLKLKTSKLEESEIFYKNQIEQLSQLSQLYKDKIKEKEKFLIEEKNYSEMTKNNEGNLKKVINDHLTTINNLKKQNDMYI